MMMYKVGQIVIERTGISPDWHDRAAMVTKIEEGVIRTDSGHTYDGLGMKLGGQRGYRSIRDSAYVRNDRPAQRDPLLPV